MKKNIKKISKAVLGIVTVGMFVIASIPSSTYASHFDLGGSDYSYDLGGSDYSYDLGGSDYSYDLGGSDYSYDLGGSDYSYDLGGSDYSYDLGGSDYSYPVYNIPDYSYPVYTPTYTYGVGNNYNYKFQFEIHRNHNHSTHNHSTHNHGYTDPVVNYANPVNVNQVTNVNVNNSIPVAYPQPIVRYAYPTVYPVAYPNVTVAQTNYIPAYDYININQVPYTGTKEVAYVLTLIAAALASIAAAVYFRGRMNAAFAGTPVVLQEETVEETKEDSEPTIKIENGEDGPKLSFK